MRGFNSYGEHVGRAKGTINKRTQEAQAIMERLGLDPLEGMIKIVLDDVHCSTCRGVGTTKYQPAKMARISFSSALVSRVMAPAKRRSARSLRAKC